MLCYCKKCGRIVYHMLESDEKICDCCKSIVYPVPDEYLKSKFSVDPNKKDEFIEKYVKPSPEFDPYLFEHRDEILAYESTELNRKLAIGNAILNGADPKMALKNGGQNIPKCPTCGSLSVKKIGGAERAVSVGMFGLFSKKINKTFKCGNCGYTW